MCPQQYACALKLRLRATLEPLTVRLLLRAKRCRLAKQTHGRACKREQRMPPRQRQSAKAACPL
eukprot:5727861-Pleurochrysis_carterae.AAC.1